MSLDGVRVDFGIDSFPLLFSYKYTRLCDLVQSTSPWDEEDRLARLGSDASGSFGLA